jgi:anaerobic carbon-monoxide dehydrogenase iron sulfur subunit
MEKKNLGKKRRVVYLSRPYEATGFCTGCRSCELACSLQNAGVFNPKRSRIRVASLGTGIDIPVTCQQCEVPWCQEACPVNAIIPDQKQDIVIVDEKKCISCERCVGACPFGIMTLDSVTEKAIKCNLCNGEPACVAICPSRVLAAMEDSEVSEVNRRRFAAALHNEDNAVRPVPSGAERLRLLPVKERS